MSREDFEEAKPQRVNGVDVRPTHWGITPAQLRDVAQKLRRDPAWQQENNMYALVEGWIKPWTRGKGIGYALSVNADKPLEVNCMVSHAWSENAEEFFETIDRSTSKDDVLFVCAFSLYQPEDGAGPTIIQQLGAAPTESPFYQVLYSIKRSGQAASWKWNYRILSNLPWALMFSALLLLYSPAALKGCVLGFSECGALGCDDMGWWKYSFFLDCDVWMWKPLSPAEKWILPVAITLVAGSISTWILLLRIRLYRGRMIAVPNSQDDLYGRLWCVYEIFVSARLGVPVELARTLASAGSCTSRNANCSCIEDKNRIQAQIVEDLGESGFDLLDSSIFWTTKADRIGIAVRTIGTMLPIAVLCAANYAISRRQFNDMSRFSDFKSRRAASPCMCFSILVGSSLEVCIAYYVLKRSQGKPSIRCLCAIILSYAFLIFIFFILEEVLSRAFDFDATCDEAICTVGVFYWMWRVMLIGVAYLVIFLLPGVFFSPGMKQHVKPRQFWAVVIILCSILIVLRDVISNLLRLFKGDIDVAQASAVIAAFVVTRIAMWMAPFAFLLYQLLIWGIVIPSVWDTSLCARRRSMQVTPMQLP